MMGIFSKKPPATPPAVRANPRGLRLAVKNIAAATVGRLFSDWAATPLSADAYVAKSARILRARARDQLANNDYVKRYVKLLHANVVGPKGVTLRAMAKNGNGELDELDNAAIEKHFQAWGKKQNCDAAGRTGWVGMQRLCMTGYAIEGEFLARKITEGPAAGEYGFSLQIIDPEVLDVSHNTTLRDGRFIKMGIEYDEYTRAQAYYLLSQDQSRNDYSFQGRKYLRVPAKEIIHCFDPVLVGQKRGLPSVSTPLARLKMLGGLEEAAITAARAGASKMGFFKQDGAEGYTGDGTDEMGNIVSDFEAGTFELLPEGVSFEKFDPEYPGAQHEPFVKGVLRGASAGFNLSYFAIANDLSGVNYTSSRTGLLEDREHYKELQEWLIDDLYSIVYAEWLGRALALGKIVNAAGVKLPRYKLDKYLDVAFAGRRWQWVDPLKEMKAATEAMESKVKSRPQVIREMGGDPRTVQREIDGDPDHPEPKNSIQGAEVDEKEND